MDQRHSQEGNRQIALPRLGEVGGLRYGNARRRQDLKGGKFIPGKL